MSMRSFHHPILDLFTGEILVPGCCIQHLLHRKLKILVLVTGKVDNNRLSFISLNAMVHSKLLHEQQIIPTTTHHHFFAVLSFKLPQMLTHVPMAIPVRSTISIILFKVSAKLLFIAKRLHTLKPPHSKSDKSSSEPIATKAAFDMATESKFGTSSAADAVILALAGLSAANTTTKISVSTVISTNLNEEVATQTAPSCIANHTTPQAPTGPSEAETRPANQESIAVSPEASLKLVNTTAAVFSKATLAAREVAVDSRKSKAATTQCTCHKRHPYFKARRTYKCPPTQRPDESSAQFMTRKRDYHIQTELDLRRRRAHQEHLQQKHSDFVRVQDPLEGHWYEMPALVASCPLHCLASRLQDERDARKKGIKPQSSNVRKHRLLHAPQRRVEAIRNLVKLKNEDMEEERKMGWTLARSCLKLAATKPATLWIRKAPTTSLAITAPSKTFPILPNHLPNLPTFPLPRYRSHIHKLQELRTQLNLYAHELSILRTTEHKIAATARALVSRNLPARIEDQKAMDAVWQKLSTVARRRKKARVLERELCVLIEGDEDALVGSRGKVGGLGGWRRRGGKERWGEW